MAASPLRVVRRPKGSPARRDSLTAASQPITDPQKQFSAALGGVTRVTWQAETWDMYDLVGELRYYVGWRAGSASRVRLVASEIDDDTGLPTGNISEDAGREGERVTEIVKAIAGGPLGQAQMIKRAAECLSLPGEFWVAIIIEEAESPGTWLVLTRQEIRALPGGGAEIEKPDGTKHVYNQARGDSMFRVWFPRARRASEPDSAVRACLDSLREIVRTTKKIKNASKSRLIGNGVMFLPQEMSMPSAHSPLAANQPGAPPPTVVGVPAADQLNHMLYNVAKVAVEDEDSQAAFIPIMATVPGEFLEKVQHIQFGNEITAVEIQTRNDAIARLAMGLDVSPERLLGLGSNSNHWSAWQIGDEDVQLHIAPVMETLCAAINDQVLKIVLEREGIDPSKYMLWYDASQLTVDPDKSEEATEAHDRGAITDEAYRKYLGLGDDDGYDLSTLEGWQLWACDAVTKNPELITTLLPLLPGVEGLDFPSLQPALPPGQDPNAEENADAQRRAKDNSEPATEGEQNVADTASAHIATSAELILAERLLVTRALELAGKRRVKVNDRAQKARLDGIAAHDYHRFMPPVTDAEIPRLIDGWDSALEDETIALLGVDTEQLREVVRRAVRRELTRPVVDAEAG